MTSAAQSNPSSPRTTAAAVTGGGISLGSILAAWLAYRGGESFWMVVGAAFGSWLYVLYWAITNGR